MPSWNPRFARVKQFQIAKYRNDRFRDERLHSLDWLKQELLGAVAGYGRYPGLSLIPCGVVVLLGLLVFLRT